MEEKLTVNQVLEMTAAMLEDIEVPMKYLQSIGMPLANSINNIRSCLKVMNNPPEKPEDADGEKDA